jgi:hypothetical protein
MRYSADITAGSLKLPESRIIAGLLLREVSRDEWRSAIEEENVLQASSIATSRRLARLLRQRLEPMGPHVWRLVRDGGSTTATHACLAAAVKRSRLLGDFLDLVLREQYRKFAKTLSARTWDDFIADCASRNPDVADWSPATIARLRSSVFQILAQAGYVDSTRTRRLQAVHISSEVTRYLRDHDERYVLRCIEVAP